MFAASELFTRSRGVVRSAEFERIRNLPRRDWRAGVDDDFIRQATNFLRLPHGRMVLRPMQAVALEEAHDCRGLFLGAGVGTGKTLVSLLLPVVLESRRPLLFVAAQLRDKAIEYDIPEMSRHWRLHEGLKVINYDALSRESGLDLLQRYSPDLIVADEAHRLAHPSSARTRRFLRYMAENPDTLFIPMSGSISKRSLLDYWHLLRLALKNRAPMPATRWEAMDWADALDEKVRNRLRPGVLIELCAGGETPRQGFQRRLSETRGVIITSKTSCPAPIIINRVGPTVPDVIAKAIKRLEDLWETPGGDMLTEALEVWRCGRQLSMGFFYRWIWPDGRPDFEWLALRREWRAFVRATLSHNRRKLDSELQVANACRRDELPRAAYDAWAAIRDRVAPKTEAVWLDDFLVRWAASYAGKSPCLVWVEHDAFGQRLAAQSGLPFFAAGATQADILAKRGGSVVLSAHSHREGKNLQAWHRNLIISAPPAGAAWDQMLGRTHREGQSADEVIVDVCLHTTALQNGFATARADAQFLHETLGQEQKLLYGDMTFSMEV